MLQQALAEPGRPGVLRGSMWVTVANRMVREGSSEKVTSEPGLLSKIVKWPWPSVSLSGSSLLSSVQSQPPLPTINVGTTHNVGIAHNQCVLSLLTLVVIDAIQPHLSLTTHNQMMPRWVPPARTLHWALDLDLSLSPLYLLFNDQELSSQQFKDWKHHPLPPTCSSFSPWMAAPFTHFREAQPLPHALLHSLPLQTPLSPTTATYLQQWRESSRRVVASSCPCLYWFIDSFHPLTLLINIWVLTSTLSFFTEVQLYFCHVDSK